MGEKFKLIPQSSETGTMEEVEFFTKLGTGKVHRVEARRGEGGLDDDFNLVKDESGRLYIYKIDGEEVKIVAIVKDEEKAFVV
jgi:hypothetical protein